MTTEKWVKAKAIEVEVGDIRGARSWGLEFRPYSKFSGKPLKGFVED